MWRESDCQGTYYGCETQSVCDDAPVDRVLLVTQTGDFLGIAQSAWESLIDSAVDTLKVKYPAVERVELLTFVRGPGVESCGGESVISPKLDAAQAAVAEASAGEVRVGPRLSVGSCSAFAGPPYLSDAGNREVAKQLLTHYAKP